jgi:hypothetical protein
MKCAAHRNKLHKNVLKRESKKKIIYQFPLILLISDRASCKEKKNLGVFSSTFLSIFGAFSFNCSFSFKL